MPCFCQLHPPILQKSICPSNEVSLDVDIGVGRFRILGEVSMFRILGGAKGSKFPAGT